MKNITKTITNNLIYIVFYSDKMDEFSNMFYDIDDAISFACKQRKEYKDIHIIAIDECLHSLLEIMLSEDCNLDESAQEAGWSQEEINNIKEYIQQTFDKTMLEMLENGDFLYHGLDYRECSEFIIEINDNNFDRGNYNYIVCNGANTPIIMNSLDEVYGTLIDKLYIPNITKILIVSDYILKDINILNNTRYNYYNDECPIDECLQQKYLSYENMDDEGNITYNIDYKDIAIGKLSLNVF